MSTAEWEDDFIERYVQIGIEQGRELGAARVRAHDVLRVLDVYGLNLTEGQRARVTASAGLEQLDRWFERALLASSVDDVFKADDAS